MIRLVNNIFTGPAPPVISGFTDMLTNLEVREYLNACLGALNLIVMVMIARQIWTAVRVSGWDWRSYPGAIFIVCLWWIFLSDLIRACLAWYLLHQQNNNRGVTFLTPTVTTMYVVAGAVAIAATLRLVYAVSPREWGHRGWLISLAVTVATVAVVVILD